MVANQPQRINDSVDYPIRFPCGCCVTFLGAAFHRASQMTACLEHCHMSKRAERDEIVAMARRRLELDKLEQPPR